MKKNFARILSVLLCAVLLVSMLTVLPSCRKSEETAVPEDDEQAALSNGNNLFIDSSEASKVSQKLITSQSENEDEHLILEVDPFMEEHFLIQVDQNDKIETVRKVAEGEGKSVYAVALTEDAVEETPSPTEHHEAETPASEPAAVTIDETVKEQLAEIIGVDTVLTPDEIDIPVSNLDKTYTGPKTDADGNLLVPFDVVYPEAIDSDGVLFEREQILLKMPKDFSGNVTRELTLCGISSMHKFIETETGDWFRAELLPGVDTVTAVKKARSLTAVIAADFDYIYETTDTAAGDEGGDDEPETTPDPMADNPRASEQWYLNSCGIPEAWQFLEEHGIPAGGASNVIVAVIDTGVDYNHPDLKTSMWVNLGEIPDNGIDDDGNGYIDDIHGVDVIANTGDPMDDHGHGTHVAGIIGAANNKEGILGVAYNTKIMAVKAGQASGVFNQSDIAEAILYAAANGAAVINMSFGGPATSMAVQDALTTAYTRSVLVAAAGNDGIPNDPPGIPLYPAAYSYVIGVMSVNQNFGQSLFSNWDPIPFNQNEYEVYAPGERILSTFPDDRYINLNGTSMAAPIVSGVAALLRSYYTNYDMYPSRFISAQISATGGLEYSGGLNVVNAFNGLTKMPIPEVHFYNYYITDNNDGFVDSGDTLEIGLELRNRWGMSKDTIVSIDSRQVFIDSETEEIIYGPENPYIQILNSSANLEEIGTYNTKSMLVYGDNNAITGINDPFVIKVLNNCPNDYTITLRINISYGNGLDEDDLTEYNNGVFGETIQFTVRSGIIKQGAILSDETWTKDNYYIIANQLLVREGVTVTVEPGTKIQFWSSEVIDPYATEVKPEIVVNGKMLFNGTAEEPIDIVMADTIILNNDGWVEITGNADLRYVKMVNPRIEVSSVDHSYFYFIGQKYFIGSQSIASYWLNLRVFANNEISYSVFDNIYIQDYPSLPSFNHCFFRDCMGEFLRVKNSIIINSVQSRYIPVNHNDFYRSKYTISNIGIFNNHSYFELSFPFSLSPDLLYSINDSLSLLGGNIACFETEEEYLWISEHDINAVIGLIALDDQNNSYEWITGEPYLLEEQPYIYDTSTFASFGMGSIRFQNYYYSVLFELPSDNCAQVDENGFISLFPFNLFSDKISFINNVILNDFSTSPDHWFLYIAPQSDAHYFAFGNYWGTTDETLIGYQIIDSHDYPTYGTADYKPYLLTPPEDVWPIVSDAYLLDHNGERVYTVGNEEVTFVVEFNRDMDTDYGLRVRFGAAEPYAEYEISGEFVTPRRWEGVYTLKTTIENGTQYFRIEDGRAADDHWLTLYERPARFQFEIDTTSAMAMVMQGEATDTGIDLTWLQDDYDTLAGYNIYRSTREDGYYTRLNNVVIPVGSEHFFDNTVEPGVVYYYNFTVVLTDMSESTPSGKITIMSKDTMAPNIYHTPVRTAFTGNNLIVSATVTDNLGLHSVKMYYRTTGTDTWSVTEMAAINNKYYGTITADKISLEGLEYYIEAFDGVNYTYNGSAASPYAVTVKQAVETSSLGDVDGDGVITGKDALMIVQAINDLLNLTEDQFMRADINGDGELSSAEALRILKYVSGKVTTIVD